jgi:NAD(P) transhydrogenase
LIYDLLVIGDEQEGTERSLSAARMGRRVGVVGLDDASASLDLMRRAVDRIVECDVVTMESLRAEVTRLIRSQTLLQRAMADRLGIERISGKAQFVTDSSVEIVDGGSSRIVTANEIIVACGTKSRQPASFQCDGRRVLVSESLLELDHMPRSSIIVGAGATGLATAMLLAKLGVEVTVIDEHLVLFDVCRALDGSFEEIPLLPIAFRLGEEVIGTELRPDRRVAARFASGRVLTSDAIVVCVGRVGKTETLNLEAVGVGLDERGRLWCDSTGHTWSPRILAVGDVVGYPSLNHGVRAERRPIAGVALAGSRNDQV